MKKIKVFTWENCVNCEALKPQLKERKDLDITYYSLEEDGRAFRDHWVKGIPVVFETYKNKEVEGTRQVGVIDITKY